MFDKEKAQAEAKKRFDDLRSQKAAIEENVAPIRKRRDAIVNKHREIEAKENAALAKAQEGLAAIDQEIAFLARQLPGYRNPPETTEQ